MPLKYIHFSVKSMLLSSVLLFFIEAPVAAQHASFPIKRSHPVSLNLKQAQDPVSGTLNILAVMVEFQPDSNRFTSGNGTYAVGGLPYLENNNIYIDPLPHDQAYFEAHLEFAKNYFERVSNSRMTVDYRVLPDVYRLDQKMEYYAPTGENFSNEQLALLARDTWQKVEEVGGFDATGLTPGNTAFIIFHAGVGRDIELTGTTLDKTPQDIPSLYLDENSLARLLNEPEFSGFPVNDGTLRVANSLILPQTLSRRGEDISETEFVIQLSINGLLCATIGSHLGLPDLFNTKTGASGIGRFGLMDGAGIFSYNGLFPPELSAWEKQYLGWVSPFEIDLYSTEPYSLPAASLRQPASSVARYSLSNEEYFLIENRHRDPDNNGSVLTIRRQDGSEIQQTFSNENETFVTQQDGFAELFSDNPGVLVNVDNYDWSLPGGIDRGADTKIGTGDDRLLNGGILIWHIDEAVIDRELTGTGVNAYPDRRGVDLEEADGAQDIGEPVQNPGTNLSNGTAFDFWWAGNNSSVITSDGDTLTLYENRFGPDTHPDNKTNSGASTFFEFYDFSGQQPIATFRARHTTGDFISEVMLPEDALPTDSVFTSSMDNYLTSYPPGLSVYTAQSDTFLVIPTGQTVYALRLNTATDPLFDFQANNPQQPYLGDQLVLANRPDGDMIDLNAWTWNGTSWQNSWNTTGNGNLGFLSSTDDNILYLDLTANRFNLSNGSPLTDLPTARQESSPIGGQSSVLTPAELTITDSPVTIPINTGSSRIYTGALQLTETEQLFYLIEENTFYLIDPEAPDPKQLLFESASLGWPALADFDRDGRLDFLYVDHKKNELRAVNSNGALLNSFPIPAPVGSRFTGTPLVSDLDGDGAMDLVIPAQDSLSLNLYAYDANGKIKSGLPLYVGSVSETDNHPVHPVMHDKTLYAVSHTGDLKAWRFENNSNIRWGSQYGNEPYNKVTGRISGSGVTPVSPSVLVKSETYNWPNPAREETYIRFQTSGPGEVEVKIITMSGRVIFDQNFEARGGPPEEHRISTASWGSGIYLAKVTANINGKEASKLIKIAVVH